NPQDGKLIKEFSAAPEIKQESTAATSVAAIAPKLDEAVESETLPAGVRLVALKAEPSSIKLGNRFDYVQLLVTAETDAGEGMDVTLIALATPSSPLIQIWRSGLIRPLSDGKATLTVSLAGKKVEVPVTAIGTTAKPQVDFIHDVMPVLSRLGCNGGTCHGAQ